MLAAQLIHAAGETSPGNLPDNTHAIALAAKDEAELIAISEELKAQGIPHLMIDECDAPYTGQFMAIGIPPMEREKLRKVLSKYPLLK